MMKSYLILLLSTAVSSSAAWMQKSPAASLSRATTVSSPLTILEARRSKPGSLGTLAKEGLVDSSSVNKSKKRLASSSSRSKASSSSGSTNNKGDNGDATISPDLARWMASQQSGEETTVASSSSSTSSEKDNSVSTAAAFQAFEEEDDDIDDSKTKGKSARRVKQTQRNQMEEQRQVQIEAAVTALEDALAKSNNLDEILSAVRSLLALPPSPAAKDNPRLLLGGKRRYDFRLAWVGSDNAICHIGTGLHKVPLARLQEIFWSCLGKNRIELLEVIRILGPFPNVRNTLQGTVKTVKSPTTASALSTDNGVTTLNIVMDSMVDGTGKEIMAGTEDNIRRVNLQLYFADERAMVAVVPPEDGKQRADPLENNGSNVLVFLREEELDGKLDSLRVS